MDLSRVLAVSAALNLILVSGSWAAEAWVTKGDQEFRFVVVQCLQNVTRPGSQSVVELQLDGVPVETPAPTIEQLKGAADDPAAAGRLLQEVVSVGPVLSVTRLKNGGDLIGVTNLKDTNWITDPSVTERSMRFLQVDETGSALQLTGESQSGGEAVSLMAECPD